MDLAGLPWWSVYDRERADLIALQIPWDTSSRYYRVIEHTHDLATSAIGLVAVSFVPGVRTDLSAYLFGDILAV